MTALDILEAWIETAHARGMNGHMKEFWVARDILEGKLHVFPKRAAQAIQFIRNSCKPSPERETILAALDERSAGHADPARK